MARIELARTKAMIEILKCDDNTVEVHVGILSVTISDVNNLVEALKNMFNK